jgi:hypothetical protein
VFLDKVVVASPTIRDRFPDDEEAAAAGEV